MFMLLFYTQLQWMETDASKIMQKQHKGIVKVIDFLYSKSYKAIQYLVWGTDLNVHNYRSAGNTFYEAVFIKHYKSILKAL